MNNNNLEEKKKLFYRIIDVIKVRMIAGIIILIPLLVTLYLLTFAFETLDGFFPTSFDQDKLAKIIWDKIKLTFPEMKITEEIMKEYYQE